MYIELKYKVYRVYKHLRHFSKKVDCYFLNIKTFSLLKFIIILA